MQRRLSSCSLFAIGMRKQGKCKFCKKTFWYTAEHVYQGCCSWNCLCRLRKKQEDKRFRNGRKQVVLNTEAQALLRIAECEARIAHYEQTLRDEALSRKERKTKNGLLWEWRRKLNDAKAILEEMRSENEQSVS